MHACRQVDWILVTAIKHRLSGRLVQGFDRMLGKSCSRIAVIWHCRSLDGHLLMLSTAGMMTLVCIGPSSLSKLVTAQGGYTSACWLWAFTYITQPKQLTPSPVEPQRCSHEALHTRLGPTNQWSHTGKQNLSSFQKPAQTCKDWLQGLQVLFIATGPPASHSACIRIRTAHTSRSYLLHTYYRIL